MAESIVSFFEHGCFRQKPSRFRGVLSRIIKACPEIPAPPSNNPLKRFDTLQILAYRRVPNRPLKKTITHYFAGVAQSVEQLIRNEKVACSIHVSGTTFIKDPNCPGLFFVCFSRPLWLRSKRPGQRLLKEPGARAAKRHFFVDSTACRANVRGALAKIPRFPG